MRGPLAGLGDSAAARAIHREASPGLRLRTKTHGPLQTPSSRYQNPLRLRVSPRSIPLTHTHKNPSGVSTTQPRTPSTHTPSHCPMLPRARECLGHKTRASTHTYVMSARARVGGSRPAVLPVASPSVAPAHPAPLLLARPGRRRWPPAPKSLPPHWPNCGPRAPPPLATAGDPFPQLTPHWLKTGTARPSLVMEPGTPITSSPPPTLRSDGVGGMRPGCP